MSMRFFVFLILFIFSASCFTHEAAVSVLGSNETDRLALLAIKADITRDPYGGLSSWTESNHFCQWVGVKCGRRHLRVTSLVLDGLGLQGSVSPYVGNLSFLMELWLRNNSLSGNIPTEMGRLHRLQKLSMRNNSISGNIPANISSCSKLVMLDFSRNNLSGEIPVELGSLPKLEVLYIGKNEITGVVPSTLGNLTSLKEFYVSENSINGIIPDAMGELKYLQVLALGGNHLVGTIPPAIFNLSSILVIDLSANQLQGKLPSDMGITLPNLQFFGVNWNSLSGSIPLSLSNASNIQIFFTELNQFTGKVPPLGNLHDLQWLLLSGNHLGDGEAHDLSFISTLASASSLKRLALDNNNFGGVLPESLGNFSTDLRNLEMENNQISGNLPAWIGSLVNLEVMTLGNNQFTGKVPDTLGKLHKLHQLSLPGNHLSGNIPPLLGNLTLLIELDLSNNGFYGNIPLALARCTSLFSLALQGNNLNGTIPSQITTLSSTLVRLYVQQNHLTGSLPMEIGNLINLEELFVSENMLSGEIPSTLGSCVKLRLLHTGSNNFHGTIPSSLSYLRGMEELDFSSNNLSGKIPDFLGGFVFLRLLNLSLNDFDGVVPETGIFRNATAVYVSGNNKLCGGIPELHLHSCNSKGSKSKNSNVSLKIVLPIACGVVGLLLMLAFIYVYSFRKKTVVPHVKGFGNEFQKVSYGSLLKATGGFSPVNLIGVGGFGSVYKGTLDQDERVVAVKVLRVEFRGASKSFITECKALKGIKHRNLVKVLTACSSIDYHGNDFKALVYEFMENGSLEEWLHPNEEDKELDKESRNLNLLQMLNIANDVASALEYLHYHISEPIIHCDLKPSNVLLDSEMTGRVSDFGLARFLSKATTNHDSSSIGIRGSVGYSAPEYGMGNEVSTSGDVYSFGILLLEMFTGKRPTDNMFSDGLSLPKFVKMALRDQVANNIIDPKLLQQRENGKDDSTSNPDSIKQQSSASICKVKECLISILEVGINCSEEFPRDRMAINNVVTQLNVIRRTHFGTT